MVRGGDDPFYLKFCHNPRVWQTDRQTDSRTHRRLIARPRLHSVQCGINDHNVLVQITCLSYSGYQVWSCVYCKVQFDFHWTYNIAFRVIVMVHVCAVLLSSLHH